jgi:trimeric autotransporter adhesin
MMTVQPFRSICRSTQRIPTQRVAFLSFRHRASFLTFVVALIALFAVSRASAQNSPQQANPTGADLSALPAAAQAQISATLGRDQLAYQSHREARGYRIGNPQHGFSADFVSSGVSLRSGDNHWSLTFSGYGYGDRLNPAHGIIPHADANRVEYRRGPLTEWYVNGPLGLEQGFTFSRQPSVASHEPLTLAFRMSGSLVASLDSDNLGLSLRQNGATRFRYAGLRATDARGLSLPAWLEITGKELRIRVDDGGAEYPVTIDPMVEAVQLTNNIVCLGPPGCGSTGQADNYFGTSVAVSGDQSTVVVGAPTVQINGDNYSVAYVFLKPRLGWGNCNAVGCYNYAARLTPSNAVLLSQGDLSVSVNGDGMIIAVGLPGANNSPGAAYVFAKPSSGWADMNETATLTGSNSTEFFGSGIAISSDGTTIVAGDPGAGTNSQGAAYVFVEPTAGWVTSESNVELTASDGTGLAYLGLPVSISSDGSTIVAGSHGENVNGNSAEGAAYVFVRPANGWVTSTETAKLTPSDGATNSFFGAAAISDDSSTIAVGSRGATVGNNANQGAIYVFLEPANGWTSSTETSKLTASDGLADDYLGAFATISGNGSAIAASGDFVSRTIEKIYVFVKPVNGWMSSTETAQLSNGESSKEAFGQALGLDATGTFAVIGARFTTVGSNQNQGSAYIFLGSAAAPEVSVSPTSLNFGNQTVFTTSAPQTVTVNNNGSAPLIVTSVSVSGPFTSTQNCLTQSPIAAGGSCSETLQFSPTSVGSAIGTLTFTDNNGGVAGSTQQLQLSGTGLAAATSTTLNSSLNPSTWGQAVTFTATVTAGAGNPTGSVTFTNGGTTLGTVALAGNSASLTVSNLIAGTHSIVATYSGDANFNGSTSSALSQVVNLATSATSLVSSVNPSYVNQSVTFTAKVVSQFGGAVTGNITFKQANTVLTVVPLAGGQATYSTTYTAAGTFLITAVYSGDINNIGSTSTAVHQIVKALPVATTTVVTTSGSPSLINQPVTFTATISTTDGSIPNGETVTFYDSATQIGASVTAGGTASFTTSSLSVKSHTIKATYAGDAMYKTSTGTVTQVVSLYASTTTVSSGLNPSTFGQGVQLTATVTSAAPGGPTGTVKFMNGTTSLGIAALSGSVAILDTAKMPAGTLTITAKYSGDAQSGTSSGTTSQTVNRATTTTTVVSSANPSTAGQSVKFTATVSSPTTIPTGSATFMDGGTALATVNLAGGKASYSTATLTSGVHDITVVYSGNADVVGSTSSVLVQTVN